MNHFKQITQKYSSFNFTLFFNISGILILIAMLTISGCGIVPAEEVMEEIEKTKIDLEVTETKMAEEALINQLLESEVFQAYVNGLQERQMTKLRQLLFVREIPFCSN